MERIELLYRPRGAEPARLASPGVGLFTRAVPAGAVLTPGAVAGVLLVLGRARELIVPGGASGRATSARPDLVFAPVGYGETLYELAPQGSGREEAPASAGETGRHGPVLRAPCAGRFFVRSAPGAPAFVAPGDTLEAGRTVGLIEVMKTFTQVHYEAGGGLPARVRVVRVSAADGGEVRAGDVLLELEPA
jgi:acetyl-CoA carboxylase biotin carboxyl carrier protein